MNKIEKTRQKWEQAEDLLEQGRIDEAATTLHAECWLCVVHRRNFACGDCPVYALLGGQCYKVEPYSTLVTALTENTAVTFDMVSDVLEWGFGVLDELGKS